MSVSGNENSDLWGTIWVGAISIVGALSKCTEWRDASGKFSWPAMVSGMAACLILAAIVRWAGSQYGISTSAQVMIAGVLCYVGPDPIIRALASVALKRIGVENGTGDKPKGA